MDQMKKESRGRKIWNKTKNVVKKIALAGVLLHGATQTGYLLNSAHHHANPSLLRQDFQEQFGFPITGYGGGIEGDARKISILSEIIHREQLQTPFSPSGIHIRSKNYLEKTLPQQLDYWVSNPTSGTANPLTRGIVLDEYAHNTTMGHEIEHIKTYELFETHPEFREGWEALAMDEEGNSLYMGSGEQLCSRFRGLENLVDKEKYSDESNGSLGFVSSYARTNFFEDIAEFCEEADAGYQDFVKLITGRCEEDNTLMLAKLELAMEYGLISSEYLEFIELQSLYKDSWNNQGFHGFSGTSVKKVKPFMEASERFLEDNVGSIYEGKIRFQRGSIVHGNANAYQPSGDVSSERQDAVGEYMESLIVPFKDSNSYSIALDNLKELHLCMEGEKNSNLSKIFDEAGREYHRRFLKGDVKLSYEGVNDLLRENGIVLPERK